MRIKTFTNKIDKLNQAIADTIKETEGNCFYEVDTTIIGDCTELYPLEYEVKKKYILVKDTNCDETHKCLIDGNDMDDCCSDTDFLLEGISLYNRMIKKTLRIWRSENPDAEMEKEDWQIGQDNENED